MVGRPDAARGRHLLQVHLLGPGRHVADLRPLDQVGAAVHRQARQVLERRGDEVVDAVDPDDARVGVEAGDQRVGGSRAHLAGPQAARHSRSRGTGSRRSEPCPRLAYQAHNAAGEAMRTVSAVQNRPSSSVSRTSSPAGIGDQPDPVAAQGLGGEPARGRRHLDAELDLAGGQARPSSPGPSRRPAPGRSPWSRPRPCAPRGRTSASRRSGRRVLRRRRTRRPGSTPWR